ncbi:unnamed protein product [Schistosoma margrebowiei]|uniref:Uncharacterized protein n=1 Tax=Schistosoma margrebowiei TaxID=48269 RepID=A0A3P8HMY1_9TREM|nr:unnamed protein product [Schistosoma margrebowiei]
MRPIWDSSAGCTCIPEFMFTPRPELCTVRSKRHRVIHLATCC